MGTYNIPVEYFPVERNGTDQQVHKTGRDSDSTVEATLDMFEENTTLESVRQFYGDQSQDSYLLDRSGNRVSYVTKEGFPYKFMAFDTPTADVILPKQVITLRVGDPLKLQFDSEGTKLSWKKQRGLTWEIIDKFTPGRTYQKSAELTDNGVYQCQVQNGSRTTSQEFCVRVVANPSEPSEDLFSEFICMICGKNGEHRDIDADPIQRKIYLANTAWELLCAATADSGCFWAYHNHKDTKFLMRVTDLHSFLTDVDQSNTGLPLQRSSLIKIFESAQIQVARDDEINPFLKSLHGFLYAPNLQPAPKREKIPLMNQAANSARALLIVQSNAACKVDHKPRLWASNHLTAVDLVGIDALRSCLTSVWPTLAVSSVQHAAKWFLGRYGTKPGPTLERAVTSVAKECGCTIGLTFFTSALVSAAEFGRQWTVLGPSTSKVVNTLVPLMNWVPSWLIFISSSSKAIRALDLGKVARNFVCTFSGPLVTTGLQWLGKDINKQNLVFSISLLAGVAASRTIIWMCEEYEASLTLQKRQFKWACGVVGSGIKAEQNVIMPHIAALQEMLDCVKKPPAVKTQVEAAINVIRTSKQTKSNSV